MGANPISGLFTRAYGSFNQHISCRRLSCIPAEPVGRHLSLRKTVPHVTMLPSAATAPQLLSNQTHNRHAAPCLEHLFIASFFALSRSFQPNDQPAPSSLALYAVAPQNV